MTTVPTDQLADWVAAWAASYPDPKMEDKFLAPFKKKETFNSDDMTALINSKFRAMAHRKANAIRGLKTTTPERLDDLTRRAFGCKDDLGAMLIICEMPSVGPALGSWLLMANDPGRYTVMDVRALKSVEALNLEAHPGYGKWLSYLARCRLLASTVGTSLRTVDRALYMAKGRTS